MLGETSKECWELMILDADPPTKDLGGLAVGDIDNDGNTELLVAGNDGLFWYRPTTLEKGKVSEGDFPVGIVLEDVDGDGNLEVVSSSRVEGARILWFKPAGDLQKKWHSYEIDPSATAGAHDLIFADIDNDGVNELIALATLRSSPGIFAYKPGEDTKAPWSKYTIQEGFFEEGLAAADFDGDGQIEIICGPDWYHAPPGGPLSGPWERKVFAPAFREMCRTALADISGNGRPDIVICESEYMDGQLSWFENRLLEDAENPWVEHPLETGLVYGHTLYAWRDPDTNEPHFLVAEMAEGGWNAPRNRDARLIEYSTSDGGKTWRRELLYKGSGTHQAVLHDIDKDGISEIVGKQWRPPKVHLWKKREAASGLTRFRHRFIDRDKPYRATDILATDVDGDGRQDIVCGAWWYRNPSWERRTIPGICQVVNAYDIDGDGREELIAARQEADADPKKPFSSDLCWLKPIDPVKDRWEEHPIGVGAGDWPHGTAIAPILPGGKIALVAGYHSAKKQSHFPEIFEVPDDPKEGPWPRRVLVDLPYGEEIVACDIDGDGQLDLVAGPYWLKNLGDGTFQVHQFAEGFKVARVRVADINGDGRPDVVVGEEALDFQAGVAGRSRVVWFENPQDPASGLWPVHIIDSVRCPHSLDVADLDGDGKAEIICGEHDPFKPYRSRCRVLVYKMAEPRGRAWFRYVVDARFEHHDGTKVIELEPGRPGIISHGWRDSLYVHLWEMY